MTIGYYEGVVNYFIHKYFSSDPTRQVQDTLTQCKGLRKCWEELIKSTAVKVRVAAILGCVRRG